MAVPILHQLVTSRHPMIHQTFHAWHGAGSPSSTVALVRGFSNYLLLVGGIGPKKNAVFGNIRNPFTIAPGIGFSPQGVFQLIHQVLLPVALMRFLILLTAALWLGGLATGLWKVTVGTFCVSFLGPTFQLVLEPAFSTVYHGLSIFVRRAAP